MKEAIAKYLINEFGAKVTPRYHYPRRPIAIDYIFVHIMDFCVIVEVLSFKLLLIFPANSVSRE